VKSFEISKFTSKTIERARYARYLEALRADGKSTENIEVAIGGATKSIASGAKAFVIFGEPQSGKTQMMIGLTARLLDEGHKLIIVLLNDNVQLLKQNLTRFQSSGLNPTARDFRDILAPEIELGDSEWVLFCKKNTKDLQKLTDRLGAKRAPVVIDDEADYATPNAKVNRNTETKIHSQVRKLIGKGLYIGVTATPARLDLNNTFENQIEHWVEFPPHPLYTGPAAFFPMGLTEPAYRLNLLPDARDSAKHIREALFTYFASVAYLNTKVNAIQTNYSMLIHTSGARVDHSDDNKAIQKAFSVLRKRAGDEFTRYCKDLWHACDSRYPGHADDLTKWILENINLNNIVVMNSDSDGEDYQAATSPRTLFTIAIGGNIVSRGVTFDNLLSMFFTRDAKHKIQQDTYIQRARMFGVRGHYLKHFELSIPDALYRDWHRCFVFHQLALQSTRYRNEAPAWIEDSRIAVTQNASVAKEYVNVDRGEMGYALFKLTQPIVDILEAKQSDFQKLALLSSHLDESNLPPFIIEFAQSQTGGDVSKVAVHPLTIIGEKGGYTEEQETLQRAKGFLGDPQIGRVKQTAVHHFAIVTNKAQDRARMIYKFTSSRVAFKKRIVTSAQNSLF
jgi:hypothetical protein